jgi:hypothetical protein
MLGVGCYAPTFHSGGRCETECPGDLQCIDNICREPGFAGVDAASNMDPIDAPPIDGPPGDDDADGVLDLNDNCPARANSDQHDEDVDALGDACDPCPHLAGSGADADGDGVGDACDPAPSIAKQRLRFFDPFTSDKQEWDHSGGVTRVGETLRTSGTSAGSAFTRLSVATGELRIAVAGTISSVQATTPHSLSLSFGFDSLGAKYHYAQFYDTGGASGAIGIMHADTDVYTRLAGHSYPGVLPTGSWAMTIDESVASQRIGLTAQVGGTTYTPLTATTTALTTSSTMTIFVRNADIRWNYFVVIETLP